jgi:hypothetical protein
MSTLIGQSDDPNQAGVLGESAISGGGSGVYGRDRTPKGNGVIGSSENGRGVWGHSKIGFGVLGESVNGRGVVATSETNYAIRGHSTKLSGIRASSNDGSGVEGEARGAGTGVIGTSTSGVGVYGKGGRLAGLFEGDLEVTGDIRLANADCAEDFNVLAVAFVEPGTVMVLGEEEVLLPSHEAYDKRVAGVIWCWQLQTGNCS